MRSFLVAGNWKMNGSNAVNAELVDGIIAGMPASDSVELLICPPFPYLGAMAARIDGSRLMLGAQTLSEHDSGAHTGEIAPSMLVDMGCTYALVGHSERRAIYGEDNAAVAAKYVAAQKVGLTPVLCVGETLEERQAGQTESIIDQQLNAVLNTAGIASVGSAVIAYEPVWAIGTGQTATPEQAQEVHAHIRHVIGAQDENIAAGVQILYGGSVKGDNAAGLFSMPDIDGGLIGGASLKSDDFLAIAEAAASVG
jgi:triosephosphate isomerase